MGLLFGMLILVGAGVIWRISTIDDHDYPFGTVVEGVGRCGSTEYYQRGRSIRIERYRCVQTEASSGEIILWYVRNGYTVRNQGLIDERVGDRWVAKIEVERIYPIVQKDGTVMIRIYDDETWRAPRFSFFE